MQALVGPGHKTVTFRNVARIWPGGGWGSDLREPKAAPPKTKQKSVLAFFRETQIQQKNGLQGTYTRVRFSFEAAYPVIKSAEVRHTPISDP